MWLGFLEEAVREDMDAAEEWWCCWYCWPPKPKALRVFPVRGVGVWLLCDLASEQSSAGGGGGALPLIEALVVRIGRSTAVLLLKVSVEGATGID